MSIKSFSKNGKKKDKEEIKVEAAIKEDIKDHGKKDSLNIKSESITSGESIFFKKALYVIIAVFVVMFFSFSITFFLTLRGAEKTMVPDLEGMDLVDGLIDLQMKELYPRVQLRYSSDPMTKGTIIDQDPQAGAIVKAGKRIKITVSKGAVIDKVGDYVGKNLEDLKMELQIQFITNKPNLAIKEPVISEYDSTPAGTIIAQKPAVGTTISGFTVIELVVSRGEPGEQMQVGDYTGQLYSDIVTRLTRANIPFLFSIDDQRPKALLIKIMSNFTVGTGISRTRNKYRVRDTR